MGTNSTSSSSVHSSIPLGRIPAPTTPGGTSWEPYWKPDQSLPRLRKATRHAEKSTKTVIHHNPAPTEYRPTRAEVVARIQDAQRSGQIPNPFAEKTVEQEEGPGADSHAAPDAIKTLPRATGQAGASQSDPRPNSAASALGGAIDYLLGKLSFIPGASAQSLPPSAQEKGRRCPVENPQCAAEKAAEAEPEPTEEVDAKEASLPRPRNEFANFIHEVDPDIFTVSMSPTMRKQQSRLKLGKVHLLVVLQDVSSSGRQELLRLLHGHLKWSAEPRPAVRISCLTHFAGKLNGLNAQELSSPVVAAEVARSIGQWDELLSNLKDFGRQNGLLASAQEDLAAHSPRNILGVVLLRWKAAMEGRPDKLEQIAEMRERVHKIRASMDVAPTILSFQSHDPILQKITAAPAEGRLTIDIISAAEYKFMHTAISGGNAKLDALGRLVRLVEKAPLPSNDGTDA